MTLYQQTISLHVTPADKAGNDYAYIPFTLPHAARRLTVRYDYSDPIPASESEGGNVIDLGLFDPRGRAFPGGAGFRGWSGARRSEFTISPESATPGYLPGPLMAGEYEVILGLYHVWDQGADVEVHVEADLDEILAPEGSDVSWQAEAEQDSPLLGPKQGFWLRGDLQSHTVHSDATGTLEQLVGKARDLDLDFLAVTDHNTISHHPYLPGLQGDGLLLIPGQEATTYYGHMNIWGTSRWCDFRCRTDEEMAAVIDRAHRSGGVCSINHPKQGGPAWRYSTDLAVDAMEVWQGPWPHRNQESLDLWDRLLAAGRRLPAVGGSDYHCPRGEDTNYLRLGQPTTWVLVKQRTMEGILEAIVAGRTCISAHPDGERLHLSARTDSAVAEMGGVLTPAENEDRVEVDVVVWNGVGRRLCLQVDGERVHEVAVEENPATVVVALPVERYVRAELVGDMSASQLPAQFPADLDLRDWRWALSNPIYVRR